MDKPGGTEPADFEALITAAKTAGWFFIPAICIVITR